MINIRQMLLQITFRPSYLQFNLNKIYKISNNSQIKISKKFRKTVILINLSKKIQGFNNNKIIKNMMKIINLN